jgi:hypothetical protein
MPARLQLVGQKFNKLTVVESAGSSKFGTSLWRCVCECGGEKVVIGNNLKTGHIKTCGCSIYSNNKTPDQKKEIKFAHEARRKAAYKASPEKRRAAVIRARRWMNSNPEKWREGHRVYQANLRQQPRNKIHSRMSAGVRASMRDGKNGRSWESILGYTSADLHRHLKLLFKPGMTWEKFAAGEIHIDHIIPKAKFSFTSENDIDFKRCWAMENLKPEWALVNTSRGSKILEPSQIALGV